jgi:hypothetical protein
MSKPHYVAIPSPSGKWMVCNMNGRGKIHGIEIVAEELTEAQADAWIRRAERAQA